MPDIKRNDEPAINGVKPVVSSDTKPGAPTDPTVTTAQKEFDKVQTTRQTVEVVPGNIDVLTIQLLATISATLTSVLQELHKLNERK